MQLSREELILIEESLRQAKQIYQLPISQKNSQLKDTQKELIRILIVEKTSKKNTATMETLKAEIREYQEELVKFEEHLNKFDILIKKINSISAASQ